MAIIFAFLTACAFSLPYEIIDTGEIGGILPIIIRHFQAC